MKLQCFLQGFFQGVFSKKFLVEFLFNTLQGFIQNFSAKNTLEISPVINPGILTEISFGVPAYSSRVYFLIFHGLLQKILHEFVPEYSTKILLGFHPKMSNTLKNYSQISFFNSLLIFKVCLHKNLLKHSLREKHRINIQRLVNNSFSSSFPSGILPGIRKPWSKFMNSFRIFSRVSVGNSSREFSGNFSNNYFGKTCMKYSQTYPIDLFGKYSRDSLQKIFDESIRKCFH